MFPPDRDGDIVFASVICPSVCLLWWMYTCVFWNYGHFSVFQWDLFSRHTSWLICVSKITYKVPCVSNFWTHKGTLHKVPCVSNFWTHKGTLHVRRCRSMRVLQKVLSLGSDYFSAKFYQTYFYYKPSKYSLFTETHFCNLFTQSRKADKKSSFGICWRHW